MKKTLYIVCMAALLSGCSATTQLPQNRIMPYETIRNVSLTGLSPIQQQDMLATILKFLPDSKHEVTIIMGPAVQTVQLATVKNSLIHCGFASSNIHVQPSSGNTFELVFSIVEWKQDLVPDATDGQEWYTAKAVQSNFGNSTEHNAAVQHVRIQDTSSPRSLDSPNPLAAVGAVERYQKGQVRELGDISLEPGEAGGM